MMFEGKSAREARLREMALAMAVQGVGGHDPEFVTRAANRYLGFLTERLSPRDALRKR